MPSKGGLKVLNAATGAKRPRFSTYLRVPGTPEQRLDQMVDLVRAVGRPGILMVDLWLVSLGNLGGPDVAIQHIAEKLLAELAGENSPKVAVLLAELAAPFIRRKPGFWATPLGVQLIHAGALDFERDFTRAEAALVLGISQEWVRQITQRGMLTAVGKSTSVTGASVRQVWLERQTQWARWELNSVAQNVADLDKLASELDG